MAGGKRNLNLDRQVLHRLLHPNQAETWRATYSDPISQSRLHGVRGRRSLSCLPTQRHKLYHLWNKALLPIAGKMRQCIVFRNLTGFSTEFRNYKNESMSEKPWAVTGLTLAFQSLKLLYPPRLEEPYLPYDCDGYADEGYDESPNWEYDLRPVSTFP